MEIEKVDSFMSSLQFRFYEFSSRAGLLLGARS